MTLTQSLGVLKNNSIVFALHIRLQDWRHTASTQFNLMLSTGRQLSAAYRLLVGLPQVTRPRNAGSPSPIHFHIFIDATPFQNILNKQRFFSSLLAKLSALHTQHMFHLQTVSRQSVRILNITSSAFIRSTSKYPPKASQWNVGRCHGAPNVRADASFVVCQTMGSHSRSNRRHCWQRAIHYSWRVPGSTLS